MKVEFSSLEPPFLEFKFVKALHDYGRAHAVLLRTSPNHRTFAAGDGDLEELRMVVDDLLADMVAAWDGLLDELFRQRGIHEREIQQRLDTLLKQNVTEHELVDDAWAAIFKLLNEARNEYQHEGYWKNKIGVGQGNGPFMVDLIEETRLGEVYLLRDVRRGLHRIYLLNDQLDLGVLLPRPLDACPECGGDELLGQGSDMKFQVELGLSVGPPSIERTCGTCSATLVQAPPGEWHCPSGHS